MSNIYITSDDLQFLGYSPFLDDQTLYDICLAASVIADNFCYQSLTQTTIEEFKEVYLSTNLYNKLFPTYLPIIKVNSIYQYYNLKSSYLIDPSNYDINNTSGYIQLATSIHGKIKINYDYGYETIPYDAKRAVILIASNLISDWRRRGQTAFENIKSLDDNQLKMQFFDDSGNDNIPPSARKILMKYRRTR